jgi:hypothetical protein
MPRGGKREGAGRKLGAVTKRTREIADRALAEGKAPLEVMLDNMRHFQQVALDAEAVIEGMAVDEYEAMAETPELRFKAMLAKVKAAAGLRQMAHECARDAAAYMHPKLSAVNFTGELAHKYVARLPEPVDDIDEWQKQTSRLQ